MKGEIKEFREKGKGFRSTRDYCGKLTLTAEHSLDATLLALLGRAVFPMGEPEIKYGRQALTAWLLEKLESDTPEAQELREHLAKLEASDG